MLHPVAGSNLGVGRGGNDANNFLNALCAMSLTLSAIGSGVMEAGCRTVVGQRLKQSGMHWTVNGANNIIALRCSLLSNRWEDFWEYRSAA